MAGDSHVPPGDVLPSVVIGSIGNVDFHEISTFHSFVFYNGSQEQPGIGVVVGLVIGGERGGHSWQE